MLRKPALVAFLCLLSSAVLAVAQPVDRKVALYANVGPDLAHYDLDVANGTLAKRDTVSLPANVQYAWPHASGRFLYVASSDRAGTHHLTAFRIDSKTGDLSLHGAPVALPWRPINITTDIPSEHVLVAFNDPSRVLVYRINPDATIGGQIPQSGIQELGFYAHQVRVLPDNRHVIVSTRGEHAADPQLPGAIKSFDFSAGLLSNEASVTRGDGKDFNSRHVDFHPTAPWLYVVLEAQNKLCLYRLANGRPEAEAAYCKDSLAEPGRVRPRQQAGAVHLHPNGRFVYVANRNDNTVSSGGAEVFGGGENTISVFSIDQMTGEPALLQTIDTRKFHPRTFYIDPTGRILVAENNAPMDVRTSGGVRRVPAGFTVFRIGNDGKLAFQRVYDVDVGKSTMYWMGLVPLAASVAE